MIPFQDPGTAQPFSMGPPQHGVHLLHMETAIFVLLFGDRSRASLPDELLKPGHHVHTFAELLSSQYELHMVIQGMLSSRGMLLSSVVAHVSKTGYLDPSSRI
ncbi:hypothetical protein MGYG_02699 [Nannizzia gypsea CBS 118893]|uniref:Uncharacterized protein n=1 Tax=Arthroderma gypseum (strain ATCC MYA-4604 / CBS 118893) TaxID=535722 RepID=E4UNT3_ARTGP|nr:hypothetical protein MGYG_02699 [Nannizzia gypsea CBS 118893]EFQ99686.1 hypothetical protein MGYG_02699 [Nannizzia gypsea CBS 118893]